MDDTCKVLLGAMKRSIRDMLGDPCAHKSPIGIAFSGGVDSTLLAIVCDSMKYDIALLTVGFSKSHDVEFSRTVASKLPFADVKHHVLAISDDASNFTSIYDNVCRHVSHADSLSWIENSIAFYHLACFAHQKSINVLVTANGIDELFCGYDAYRRILSEPGTAGRDATAHNQSIDDLMRQKLDNELRMFDAINQIISEFNIVLFQPLLSANFCSVAYNIPLSEKITGPDDMYRKHVIRRLAKAVGVPNIAYEKRKKALQYGTGIHKAILKIKKRTL